MKTHSIFIYTPFWSSFGGGENYVASLDIALSTLPNVSLTLLSTDPNISKREIEQYFSLSLSSVGFEYISGGVRGIRKVSELKNICRGDRCYLLFVLTNYRPIPVPAPKAVCGMQAPYGFDYRE